MLIGDTLTLAAGAFNQNVVAGKYIEFVPRDGIVQFGLTSDSAAAIGDLRVDVLSGTDIIAQQVIPRPSASTPVFPDDFHLSDAVAAGDRIIISVRNGGGVSHTLYWAIMYDKG